MDKISFITLALAKKSKGGMKWLGITTTTLSDGDTTNPITINGTSVSAEDGDMVQSGTSVFIYDGEIWQEYETSVSVENGCVVFS